jgi:hypothetical protein
MLLPDGDSDVSTRPSGKRQTENVPLLLTLFVYYLFRNGLNNWAQFSGMQNYRWIINWNKCGRKRSWPILRHYPGCCLKEWWRLVEGLSRVSWCCGWDSKHEPSECISKYYHLKTTGLLYGYCYYYQIVIRIKLYRVLAKLNSGRFLRSTLPTSIAVSSEYFHSGFSKWQSFKKFV